jgi:glycosyltransferase involved in cell wall biosynthesis
VKKLLENMKNKNILINATCDSEKPSGVGIFNRELTKNLIRINPELFSVYETIDFLPDYKNKKLLSVNLSASGAKGHFLRWSWEQTLLNFSKADLIFSPTPEGPILSRNKALVIHDILAIKYPEYYPRQKYYCQYVLPLILKRSRMLFFDSESSKNEVYNYYHIPNIPCKVIYPGYDTNAFKPLEKGFVKTRYGVENYFLFVGEMRPYKNVTNAIIAFHKSDLKGYKFLIVGKKDEKFFPAVLKLVTELSINDKVIFLDYIPFNELPHLYADASALVFPSEYEGFGLPPLEAMATGTPVITSKLTSLPEVCGDAALYINPKNIDEISAAMIRIKQDEILRAALRDKSIERSKMFGWEKCANEYYKVLISLLW